MILSKEIQLSFIHWGLLQHFYSLYSPYIFWAKLQIRTSNLICFFFLKKAIQIVFKWGKSIKVFYKIREIFT